MGKEEGEELRGAGDSVLRTEHSVKYAFTGHLVIVN